MKITIQFLSIKISKGKKIMKITFNRNWRSWLKICHVTIKTTQKHTQIHQQYLQGLENNPKSCMFPCFLYNFCPFVWLFPVNVLTQGLDMGPRNRKWPQEVERFHYNVLVSIDAKIVETFIVFIRNGGIKVLTTP